MNGYPFNDAGEPMCSGDQYRRDCEDSGDREYDDDQHGRIHYDEAMGEEIAERLGVYDFLTESVRDQLGDEDVHSLCDRIVHECTDFLLDIEDTVDSNRGQWALRRFAADEFFGTDVYDLVERTDRSIRGYLPSYTEPWDDVVYARLGEYKTTREAVDHVLTLAEDISEHLMSHVLCQGDEDSQIPFVLDGDEPFVSSELMLAVTLLPVYDWDTEAVADAAPWILYLADEVTINHVGLHLAIERGDVERARETARAIARAGKRELWYRRAGAGVDAF